MITNTPTPVNDIRDIKPPLEISSGWEWLWWTLGVLAVLTILVLVWRYWHRRMTDISVVPVVPAHIRAKQMLERSLAFIVEPKQFCTLVSDTIRVYLEERFNFRAPERTTEEFLRELQATDLLSPEQKEKLGKFLASCDLVKFAKYEPGENELRELHSSAVRLVEETEPAETQNIEAETKNATFAESQSLHKKADAFPKGKMFAICGTILQLGNTVFFFAYIVGISRTIKLTQDFSQQVSHQAQIDLNHPFALVEKFFQELQDIEGVVLVASGIGVFVGLIGLFLIFVALIKQKYRAEWFFWFLTIYSVILLGVIPLGTVLGIFFLVYCLTKRREFLNRT